VDVDKLQVPQKSSEQCYIGTPRDDVDEQEPLVHPQESQKLRAWNNLSIANDIMRGPVQPQSKTSQQQHGKTPSETTPSSVQVVRRAGDTCKVKQACTSVGDGYLCLAVGDVVELLYIGKEGSADVGWIYGTKVATSEKGWLPQISLDAVVLQKDVHDLGVGDSCSAGSAEALKGRAELCPGCEAKATRFVQGAVAGYLTVHEDAHVMVQYIGKKPEELGWIYGYVDGKKEAGGWLPCDALVQL
jgi:hypothetical protein